MKHYTVSWEMDFWADSPRAAAEQARAVQLDPGSIATVFHMVEADGNGDDIRVDLEEPESEGGHGIIHGVTCPKRPHTRDGYPHGEDDDTRYDVDGVSCCGRCHTGL